MYLANEVFEHFFSNAEIGNHTVFHRANRVDIARHFTEHQFRFRADGFDHRATGFGVVLNRHHRWLIQHNAFAVGINQRIGRTQVNRQVI